MLKRYSYILLLPELSVWLFVVASVLSYHQNSLLDNIYGWPYPYYKWFYMEDGLHHSTNGNNLLADVAISIGITLLGAAIYQFAKKK